MEKEIKTGKGWRELSKDAVEIKPLTLESFKEFLQTLEEERVKDRNRISKMEKETMKTIKEIEKKHKIPFSEFPIPLQAILSENMCGNTFMAGLQFYQDFEEKYPEFAYLLKP